MRMLIYIKNVIHERSEVNNDETKTLQNKINECVSKKIIKYYKVLYNYKVEIII